jgi:hypothetical protein
MFVTMLLAMLWRRDEYAGHHGPSPDRVRAAAVEQLRSGVRPSAQAYR